MTNIETDRLVLRQWRESDAEDLFKYASDERVSDMALWPRHTSVEMSRQVIREYFNANVDTLALVLRETDEVIGCIGLVPEGEEHYSTDTDEREVGYWIGYPYWGRGLTTEALKALVTYCKDSLGLRSLILTADCRNIGSRRVAEKCGFVEIGRYDFDGIDSVAYRRRLPAIEIRPCRESDYEELAAIWERSVRATHDFLTEAAITEIRAALIPCYFSNVEIFVLSVDEEIAGFIGLAGNKIEMLFIDDCRLRKGFGSRLVEQALKLGAVMVDVNEQNPSALEFYKAKGFHVISRDEVDDARRPYPILHMSL